MRTRSVSTLRVLLFITALNVLHASCFVPLQAHARFARQLNAAPRSAPPAAPHDVSSVLHSSTTTRSPAPTHVNVATSSASKSQAHSTKITTHTTGAQSRTPSTSVSIAAAASFNVSQANNLAVYWGQTAAAGQATLMDMCTNKDVDLVVLAFITAFSSGGGFPEVNFGAGCGGQSPAQVQANATGLLYCTQMSTAIKMCQANGKKVLVSLGGSTSAGQVDFASAEDASTTATMLWNLFGGGSGVNAGLRPFGSIKLDGFDIDTEDKTPDFYPEFVTSLRKLMATDATKKYLITGAPQCPTPDASIPLAALQQMDMVFVQFYNNPQCNLGSPGFAQSFTAWSKQLSGTTNKPGPKVFVGAPGCTACAGSGYLAPAGLSDAIKLVKKTKNMGGIVLWDGSEAKLNVQGGSSYLEVAKAALA